MKRLMKKRIWYLIVTIILVSYFIYFQNNSIVISDYTIKNGTIPPSFDGYKIVQLSDLHSKSFGRDQNRLVKKVEKIAPDLIVFTGDLVDSKRYDEVSSLLLMEELVQLAPVYFVTGNHEWWSGKIHTLEGKLTNIGVSVLRNIAEDLYINSDMITIIGIDDPAKLGVSHSELETAEIDFTYAIEGVDKDHQFTMLLAHRPELVSLYSSYSVDLVFSGHAHGGQFRVPFIGGLIAPNQGLFPKYSSGKHQLDGTTMIVNRGLGNSIIPIRLFNRPEVVVVTLDN
ncbi:metallophosphoesterase [Anaerobacillus alkaliphilus]|uniref:Metallophosphoesterase n=1 Tax=Anaerobacillus alkaliphilus TaxID=1548597 RepID=A0A4Q0VXM2_9BACI|nr:metallophosphoesterase [Anaerobacillus alkaliphilus]RXJ04289.1 metallophosphoesterase [Anaerobacillus alkaliphilus]